MDKYIFHINPYDIIFIGTMAAGLVFALLLIFTKRSDQAANRVLGLALVIVVFWTMELPAINIQPRTYFIYWNSPPQFSLILGPLIYFYVLKKTRPDHNFSGRDFIHFSPLLLELAYWLLPARQSILALKLLNPVLLSLAFISVTVYLYRAYSRVKAFHRWLKFNAEEQDKNQLRWLQHLLLIFVIMWLIWMPCTATSYFFYHPHGIIFYDAFYIALAATATVVGASAILKPGLIMPANVSLGLPAQLAQKGDWLRKTIETGLLYQDPDLTLNSLGKAVGVHPHEVSRIINLAIGKNFNDLINEYRILDVKRKMDDPAYNRLTLLGIAQSAGFNSRATFNRAFRQMTGKSAVEYKNELKKVRSNHKLRQNPRFPPVISLQQTTPKWYAEKLNRNFMLKNYLKIAWRRVLKNRASSVINIGGLAVGLTVAMLIGLWIRDELSFNKYHKNYNHIAQVMLNQTFNGEISTGAAIALPLEAEIRKSYSSDFKHIVMASWNDNHILSTGDKNVAFAGSFVGSDAPEMLTLKMLKGNWNGLKNPSSLMISNSVAKVLFGSTDPMGKTIKLDNKSSFNISGVYADLPAGSTFGEITFMAPWEFYANNPDWIGRNPANWSDNSLFMYVQVADNADMTKISDRIKDVVLKNGTPGVVKTRPALFLQPMCNWHLYSEFKNGVNVGGAISYVWLFGTIGLFVLLLACINFMNLSTARSEKLSKEVGIRKAVGSLRRHLVGQFFCESLLIALLAFSLSLLLVTLALPYFDDISGKHMSVLWGSPWFWLAGAGFTLFTGIIAGSYPAFYLSSFQPVKVLKGAFKAGRMATLPRKVLVVVQFTVSIILIIGTVVVFKQIQFAKDRPVGYSRAGLIDILVTNNDLYKNFNPFRTDLLASGMVSEVTGSSSPTTDINNTRGDVSWQGKDPSVSANFANIATTSEYGKVAGWKLTQGRDFDRSNINDSTAVILNEAAVKYMGLKNPVGQLLKVGKRTLTVIGVAKDMVMASPYEPAKQTLFYLLRQGFDDVIIRINPKAGTHRALAKIEQISKIYSPSVPFAYRFADDEYGYKFANEERIGRLATTFAVLAIFISCLGLFGMASFMAEQRTKELGIRKVLGATVFGLWQLLSVDFIMLVVIAFLIAAPVALYCMKSWLQHFTYRADISWWIFAVTAIGALLITLLTVSYQSIKAASVNPVKSLKGE